MKSRQAEAALADAGAPGGRSGEEYLMWCAALRQERADKHTAVITPGVEQHRAVVRVEVPICLFLNRFGSFFARVPSPEP